MKNQVVLPDFIVKELIDLPETGMGYQLVKIGLKDGRVLDNVMILNCSVAIVDINIAPSDVRKVELKRAK
jgi:hypothetical protein